MTTALEPWERQPGETPRQYDAFRLYLEHRTLDKTRRHLGHKNARTVEQWSARNSWLDRLAAWQTEETKAQTGGVLEELEKRGRRQAEIATLHGEALALPARELIRRLQADPKLMTSIPLEQLLRLEATSARAYKQAMIAERLARGMSTENVAGSDGGPLLPGGRRPEDLADEELERMMLGGDGEGADTLSAYLQGRDDAIKEMTT